MPKRRSGAPADLEEVRPRRFIIHNPAVGPTLRGAGLREGDRFTLTSERGAGLVGRLRNREFTVLTLADQVAALPPLPPVAPLGASFVHACAKNERLSLFTGVPPAWQPAPATAETNSVELREGQIARRRKGRGPSSYARVARDGLQPISEDAALCAGYALAAQHGPIAMTGSHTAEGYLLPDWPLPAAHHALLGRIAIRHADGWLIAPADRPLAHMLLANLGLLVAWG
ncbi:MAG: hypothetical protein EI684_07620 [Candidatus Viridilinea halotolerans]|uniref:Uncharacterized protein n=1 Tax=Candidatus Viridilinea halotolerans TaxID=2491704 RepID=A0A426U300_9CHLR|nr:MAG: hypothetical protein EI684_07620 [Candidatus Viridilinea halotolerans]